jgi:hypothetical protein
MTALFPHNPAPLPSRHACPAEVRKTLTDAGFKPLLQAQGRWPVKTMR